MQSENLLEPANYSSHKIKWGAWGVKIKAKIDKVISIVLKNNKLNRFSS